MFFVTLCAKLLTFLSPELKTCSIIPKLLLNFWLLFILQFAEYVVGSSEVLHMLVGNMEPRQVIIFSRNKKGGDTCPSVQFTNFLKKKGYTTAANKREQVTMKYNENWKKPNDDNK